MKIDTFDQYQELTGETAVYPDGNDGLEYLHMGAVGEAGEICNKMKKIIRGDHKMLADAKEAIADECGDVFWYISELAKQYRFPLSKMALNDVRAFEIKIKTEPGLLYKYAVRLSFVLAQFANIYESGFMTADIKVDHMRTSMYMLVAIIKTLELDTQQVLSSNILKLKKRKNTNTIKGTGDKRQEKDRIIKEPSVNKIVNRTKTEIEELEETDKAEALRQKRLKALEKARAARKAKKELADKEN